MTLDELLKQNSAWLDQALKRRLFDKVDDKTVNFPEEQIAQRVAALKTRIEGLSRRKEEALASYDGAIALEKAELDALEAQKSPTKPSDPVKPPRGTAKTAKRKRS